MLDLEAGFRQHLLSGTPVRRSASRTAAVATVSSGDTLHALGQSAANRRSATIARTRPSGFSRPGFGEARAEAAEDLFVEEIGGAARGSVKDHKPDGVRADIDHTDTRRSARASGPSKRGTPKGPHSG
jgi:hypothetical protein